MLSINLQGEEILLLPERAMYWTRKKIMIVADLHWGKTGHFRKNGIAIPVNTQHNDEIRLSALIKKHNVDRLIVAGDFFHSKQNKETESFKHWRDNHRELQIELVAGNHDILPAEQYAINNIIVHDNTLILDPFIISHDYLKSENLCIHGHVHPSFSIRQNGQRSITLSCFCKKEDSFILPAFGSFTGTHKINDQQNKNIYIIADELVTEWI